LGRRELVELICPTVKAKYFLKADWTGQITLESLRKIADREIRRMGGAGGPACCGRGDGDTHHQWSVGR
jgi:hypothetical protein